MKVEILNYTDLTPAETDSMSNNGSGKEYASYLKVTHDGQTILLENDAMEPEDARFDRGLKWIKDIIEKAYNIGLSDNVSLLW
jgi:hypothetical protein